MNHSRSCSPAVPASTPSFGRQSLLVLCRVLPWAMALGFGAAPDSLQAQYKVLFIGNSFTQGAGDSASSVGGVPGIFDRLAQAGGQADPTTVMRAVGGMDYEFHSQDATTQSAIQSQPWDYVILQNYSTEPTHLQDGSHSLQDHFTYGTQLYDQIMANHAGTRVVLYETWSRAADHALITGVSSPTGFASTDQFQEELRTNYQALATQLNAAHPGAPRVTVAGVGDSWQNAGGLRNPSDPEFINTHATDRYHGNDHGYYLAAAVFYSHIYGVSPVGLSTNPLVSGLNLNLTVPASYLEEIAWTTVSAYLEPPVKTYLFDFGATDATTSFGAAPQDPLRYWNNVTRDVGTNSQGMLTNIVTTQNEPSTLGLAMVQRFNGVNGNGTTSSTHWPEPATQDSLFGNTENFDQQSNVFPSFKLIGLDTALEYRLTFHASRTGVSDVRETTYTVSGSQEFTVSLDAANNVEATAMLSGVRTQDGEMTISLSPGPNNNNSFHFTYLGILQLEAAPPRRPVEFEQEPEDRTATEFRPVTFHAAVTGTAPIQLQWFRDGLALPGETDSELHIPQATLEMHDTLYNVQASNAVSTITSRSARLTVLADTNSPLLVNVTANDGRTLALEFDESIQTASALDPAHYAINGGAVSIEGLDLISDRIVILTLSQSISGTFTLTVQGILDLAGNAVAAGTAWTGEIVQPSRQTILIDFGATGSTTSIGSPPDDPDRFWNNVTDVDGQTAGRVVGPFLTEFGLATVVSLAMISRFNGANTSGTTGSTLYPGNATRDSLYGNTEVWGGLTAIYPAFQLRGLKPELAYDLQFYGSRLGVSDNRQTEYRVEGATTNLVSFDAANNIDSFVVLSGVAANLAGEISIYMRPGNANNNANHFTYLGALEIRPSWRVGKLYPPVLNEGTIRLDWEGPGVLEEAPSWDGPWSQIQPTPQPPHWETVRSGEQRFYRLRAD